MLFDATQYENENKELTRCPEIMITIAGIPVKTLIDTGSEITCISSEFYQCHLDELKILPKLPLAGKVIRGATGAISKRIRIQLWADIKIGNSEKKLPIIIVPGLVRTCIFGYDALKQFKININTAQEELTDDLGKVKLRFQTAEVEKNELQIQICLENETQPLEDDHELKHEISLTDIQEKLDKCKMLSPEEKKQFADVIWKYRRVFRPEVGYLHGYQHQLIMKTQEIFFQKPYPISMHLRPLVRIEIDKMIEMGIIRRSNSPYGNPMVVVPKKNGSVRLCLDARKLNLQLVDDHESPWKIDELYQQCTGVKVMSSFDLQHSFWQMPLSENSKKYTAFQFEGRTYEFNVVPFGLKTSGAALIRGLEKVICEVPDTLTYIDDILCLGKEVPTHIQQVEGLLHTLDENNLTLNFEKTQICREEAEFLGLIITTQGIKPKLDKLNQIRDYPPPKNIKQVRGFLGFVNFYAKFAQNYAHETIPLLRLIKKGTTWTWSQEEQTAFERIKQLFIDTITLAHPITNQPFILTTDASDYAIGATLSQRDEEGYERVIAFISRTLKGAEKNYFTTEKELLAIIWALKKFISYIQGARIIVRTDHQALTFLKTCKFTNQRLTRWILSIQDYNLEIMHIKGKNNIVADILSRQRNRNISQERTPDEIIIAFQERMEFSSKLKKGLKNMDAYQKNDNYISKLLENIDLINNKNASPVKYVCEKDVLYQCEPGRRRVVLPKEMLVILTAEIHELYGHIGARKVYRMITEAFVCKGMRRKILQQIATCDSCQRNKHTNQRCSAPMQNIIPEGPRDLLSIDFLGPLPTSRGGVKHLLVTIDAFSKFVVIYPIKKANTPTVIKKIFENYIIKYGKPRRIQCDHGTQFTSALWRNKLQEEQIELIFSSIRHPQGNIVERVNRELGRFFRTFVNNNHTNWAKYVERIQTCLNETTHETTEFTPVELHLNKKPERLWKKWIQSDTDTNEISHTEKLCLARERIIHKGRQRKQRHDQQKKFSEFNEGEEVLVIANNISNNENRQIAKFFSIYEGPYEIHRKVGEATYLLTHRNKKERGRFHISKLKPYRRGNLNATNIIKQ